VMDLSIIVVNWNTRDLLGQCLSSLYANGPAVPFEVFVVDNASDDGSAAMVKEKFPQAQLIINTENVGFARANNQVINNTSSKYLLLLNSDTIILPGAIDRLVEFMDNTPTAGAAGAKTLNPDGSMQECYGRFPSVFGEILGNSLWSRLWHPNGLGTGIRGSPLTQDTPFEVDRVTASCLLVRRETIESVGALDERFFMYSEEVDWYLRMKRAGWKVFCCPGAQIIHHWGGSSQQCSADTLSQLYRSKRMFFRKHQGLLAEGALRYGLAARFLVKSMLCSVSWSEEHRAKAHLQRRLFREMFEPVDSSRA
jgi:N-acetylglucosaminyl-diphospho-decaprenol L-rhamnosyltransferase